MNYDRITQIRELVRLADNKDRCALESLEDMPKCTRQEFFLGLVGLWESGEKGKEYNVEKLEAEMRNFQKYLQDSYLGNIPLAPCMLEECAAQEIEKEAFPKRYVGFNEVDADIMMALQSTPR